jgi:C4-dicarboxylate-specific signal transduction histidine kinase
MLKNSKEIEMQKQSGHWQYIVASKEMVLSDEASLLHSLKLGGEIDLESIFKIYHQEDRRPLSKVIIQCIVKNEPFKIRIRIMTKTNETKNIEMSGKAFLVNKKCFSIQGDFWTIDDDLNSKKTTKEITDHDVSIVSSHLVRTGDMAANLAHDINNPLTVILGHCSRLTRLTENPEKLKSSVGAVERASGKIQAIVKNLQNLSINANTNLFEESNIVQTVKDAVNKCSGGISAKRVIIYLNELPDEINILCNEIKIKQILLNLIINAKESVLASDVKNKWVKVDLNVIEDFIKIDITDSGPEIPIEIRPNIMECFYTTKLDQKGYGIGLTIVQSFVKDHYGEFYLDESRDNTCFSFEIPTNLSNS